MNKRVVYLVIGLVLTIVSLYLLIEIIQAVPEAAENEPQIGVMPDTSGDPYLAKILGSLLLGSLGIIVAVTNIIWLINGKKRTNKRNP